MATTASFNCESITISPNNGRTISISAEEIELTALLDNYSTKEILNAIDIPSILDELGVDVVISHFGLDKEE